jgi:hypothetical protein
MAFHIRPEGRYNEVKGSPYLFDDWRQGRIFLKDDTVGGEFRMRYNIYGNEMQFINKTDTFSIANPLKVSSIWIDGHQFEYLPFVYNENANMAFFEVLVPGKTRLLVRHAVRLDSGMDPVTPYHCQNSADRFMQVKSYYYQTIEMEGPVELPSSNSGLKSITSLNQPEVKEYIKVHKIRLHNEKDLIELFSWLNQSQNKK